MKSLKLLSLGTALFACTLSGNAFAQVDDAKFAELMKRYLASDAGQSAIGNTVENYFQNKQRQMAQQKEDEEKRALEDQLKNPVKIEVGSSPVIGKKDAPITIIEFSDFQCPFCKRGADTIKRVLDAYPNDVKLAFKNLPLGFHKEAKPAAKAALAAGRQGKFWEYHDKLFANQSKLGSDLYEQIAKDLELDVAKWKKDLEDPAIEKQIEEDTALAEKHGIQGTPGFFVGGVAVKGAYPFEHFKMLIEKIKAKK